MIENRAHPLYDMHHVSSFVIQCSSIAPGNWRSSPRFLSGPGRRKGWNVSWTYFARSSFTHAALDWANAHQAACVDLARLHDDLQDRAA